MRSYGDARYYNIANYLEKLKNQFVHLEDPEKMKAYINFKKENFLLEEEVKVLEEEVAKRTGKAYLIFFCEVCPGGVMLKRIIISA